MNERLNPLPSCYKHVKERIYTFETVYLHTVYQQLPHSWVLLPKKMAKLSASKNLPEIGMAIIRVFTGYYIYRYGLELFNIEGLLDFLKKENILFPVFTGYAAKLIEFIGGICLIIGLFTRWVTPPLMVVMYGVIYTTAHGSIFEGEFPFLFMLLFGVFFIHGSGKWSVDYWLANKFFKKDKQV